MRGFLADKAAIRKLFYDKPAIHTSQVESILAKHGYRGLCRLSDYACNFVNRVLDCETDTGYGFILKIQFREVSGESLAAEYAVTKHLGDLVEVPVCYEVIYDTDRDVLPYDYLLFQKVSGIPGADISRRLRLRIDFV